MVNSALRASLSRLYSFLNSSISCFNSVLSSSNSPPLPALPSMSGPNILLLNFSLLFLSSDNTYFVPVAIPAIITRICVRKLVAKEILSSTIPT